MKDELLGELTFDKLAKVWECRILIENADVHLSFSDAENDLAPCKQMIALLIEKAADIRNSVATDVADFQYEEQEQLEPDELAEKLTWHAVSYDHEEGAECYFDGGDQFGDNEVMVDIENDGTLGEAYISG